MPYNVVRVPDGAGRSQGMQRRALAAVELRSNGAGGGVVNGAVFSQSFRYVVVDALVVGEGCLVFTSLDRVLFHIRGLRLY